MTAEITFDENGKAMLSGKPLILDRDGEALPVEHLRSFPADVLSGNFEYSMLKFVAEMPRTRVIEYRSGSDTSFYVIRSRPAHMR